MMAIKATAFLTAVNQIAAEGPSYRKGGYARDGTCDCIGLVIGAIRRCGGVWPGTHGSNFAARNELQTLCRLTPADMHPGMLLLKAKDPHEGGYALPAKYYGSGDQRDYYHAGVCISTSPLRIVHCTGTGKASGIVQDTAQGKWLWGGLLRRVSYDAAPEPSADAMQTVREATVWSQNRGPVKIRAQPSKTCRLWNRIPYGAKVAVLETDTGSPGWWRVQYGKRKGYMLSDFLSVG